MSKEQSIRDLKYPLLKLQDENGKYVINSLGINDPSALNALIKFITQYGDTRERQGRVDENKMYHYALQNAGLHEPDTVGLRTFSNRISVLEAELEADKENV